MKTAICCSKESTLKKFKKKLTQLYFKVDFDVYIDEYTSSIDLLKSINEEKIEYDLIFISMFPEINLIDLVTQIKKNNYDIFIVFFKNSKCFLLDNYKVNDFYYRFYFIDEESLLYIIKKIYLLIYNEDRTFSFVSNRDVYNIKLKNIIYFEVKNRIITINYLKDNKKMSCNFYGKLQDIENRLQDKNFMRCHRSYLVNMNYIYRVSDKEIILYDDFTILLSKKYVKIIKKKLLDNTL